MNKLHTMYSCQVCITTALVSFVLNHVPLSVVVESESFCCFVIPSIKQHFVIIHMNTICSLIPLNDSVNTIWTSSTITLKYLKYFKHYVNESTNACVDT